MYKAHIMPALSAPDLQCIKAGYSIDLNNFLALNIISFSGAARDLALKSINFILFFYKESGYKNKLRFLILPLITYLYCYFNIYIDYPGTFLTYFFNTAGIQYDDWINYGNNLFKQKSRHL